MLSQKKFAVWRTQIMSVLTGLGLLGYIDDTVAQLLTNGKPNPAFIIWNRQDKYILDALLGSCHETIQPLISTVTTSKQM